MSFSQGLDTWYCLLFFKMPEEYDDADFVSAAASLDRSSAGQRPQASSDRPKVVQPTPQALPSRQGPSAILVSTRQKGNPILNYVKSLPWEYSDIPCDYVVGATTCALFLVPQVSPTSPRIYLQSDSTAGEIVQSENPTDNGRHRQS